MAFQSYRNGNWDVYVMNVTEAMESETGEEIPLQQITNSPTPDEFPSWSPDGTQFVYESQRGDEEIYMMDADGSDQRPLTANRFEDYGPQWRPEPGRLGEVQIEMKAGDFGRSCTLLVARATPELPQI